MLQVIAMARLSKVQAQARQQILQLEALTLLPEAAAERILAALQLAIPADVLVMLEVDPRSLLFNRILALGEGPLQGCLGWLQRVYLAQEPLPELTFPGLMQANLSAIAIHDFPQASLGIPPQTMAKVLDAYTPNEWNYAYHSIATPVGGILRACFSANGRWIAGLEAGRSEARPFRPSDVGLARP